MFFTIGILFSTLTKYKSKLVLMFKTNLLLCFLIILLVPGLFGTLLCRLAFLLFTFAHPDWQLKFTLKYEVDKSSNIKLKQSKYMLY